MVQQTEKFSNLQDYFERAIPQIVIVMDESRGTVAWVPATNSNDPYVVTIDESNKVSHATKCTCNDHWYRKSYCRHMQAADLYFQNIAAIFAHTEEEEPEVEQPVEIDEPALEGIYLARLQQWTAYNAPKFAYGCCGHLVHIEDAGELCGPCRCK
jgi:hypothetical protein